MVSEILEELNYRNGECIVREGDVGDSLYLIRRGGVKITKRITPDKIIDLAETTEGESFGEMAVVDEEVRSASVIAKGECVLLRISRDDLIEIIHACPSIGVEMLKIFVKRLRVQMCLLNLYPTNKVKNRTKLR